MSGCRTNTKYFTLCLLFLLTTLSNSIDVETPKGNSLPLDVNTVLLNRDEANTFLNKERTRKLLTKRQLKDSKLIHIDRRILKSCGTGQWWEDGMFWDECHKCGAGRYQDKNRHQDTSCKACPVGYYTWHTSDWECYKCPAGFQQPKTAQTSLSSCWSCPSGTRSNEGSQWCYGCNQGTQFVAKNTGCRGCSAGQYQPSWNIPSASCKPCGVGKRSSKTEQSFSCVDCQRGKIQLSSGKDFCSECENGKKYISAGVACVNCVPGRFSERATQSIVRVCINCEVGYYSDQPATYPFSCTSCNPGRYG